MERRLTVALLLNAPERQLDTTAATLFRLAEALADAHHAVHVFSAGDFLINCSDRIHLFPEPPGADVSHWRYRWAVWRWLRRVRPDVVHTHDRQSTDTVAWLRRFLPPMRWIVSLHPDEPLPAACPAADRVILTGEGDRARLRHDPRLRVLAAGGELREPMPAALREQVRQSLHAAPDRPLIALRGGPNGMPPAWLYTVIPREEADICLLGEGRESPDGRYVWSGRRPVAVVLQAADLMVIHPESRDVMGDLTDALHAGCPPVSPVTADTRAWLPDYLLYEAGSPDNLRAVIRSALALRPNLRRGCLPVFLRARQELTADGVTRQLLDLYNDLMETRHEPFDY